MAILTATIYPGGEGKKGSKPIKTYNEKDEKAILNIIFSTGIVADQEELTNLAYAILDYYEKNNS